MSDTQYESSCHIWPGLIAVHPAELQIALRHLRGSGRSFGVEELTELLVQGYYSEVSGSDDVRNGAEDRAQVLLNSIAGLIAVDNATEQSQALRAEKIEASPIHAFGYSGHSGMMPATTPDDFTGDLPTNGCERSKRIVAVIDSGIVRTGHVDSWKKSGCVQFDDLDIEQLETSGNSASHGTFVTSIIRTVAPTVRISVARAGALDINQFETMETQEGHDVAQWPTTELHVADAMLRLLERHRQERVVALNLSLGARLCYTNDPVLVVLRNSLRMWMKQQPLPECTCGLHAGTEIFAAGGNTTSTSPIFPAAYRFVRGVGATTCDKENGLYGKQIVWVDGDPVRALERCWISDVAPGADLVGLSGDGDHLVSWSGSSFASAVAAASYAGDSTNRRVEQLVTWWMTKDGECDDSLPHTTAAMFDPHA